MHTLLATGRGHVQVSINDTVRPALRRQQGLGILELDAALLQLQTARLHQEEGPFALLLLPLVLPGVSAAGIAGDVAVPQEVLLVRVLDRLKVALGRLEAEAVALLQGHLDVFLLLRPRREGLALGELLVLEERAGSELGVFRVGDGRGILLVQHGG